MRACGLLLVLGLEACADPTLFSPAEPSDPSTAVAGPSLRFQPTRVSLRSEAGQTHFIDVDVEPTEPLLVDGVGWDGDDTWDVGIAAPSLPIRIEGSTRVQLEVRTGLPPSGGALVFWSRDRPVGRLAVERWLDPSLELLPAHSRAVGVTGTRLRLLLGLDRRAESAATIEWRIVADPALQVSLPPPTRVAPADRQEVELFVHGLRPGDWNLRVAALGPDAEAWATVALHFESAEAWRFEVFAEPDESSALITDLRRFETWSEDTTTEAGARTQLIVGPSERSTDLGLLYVEDCEAAPSALLSSLFGATLTTLLPGSADWRRVVDQVCVARGPLDLRWTFEQGGAAAEGRASLRGTADRLHIGRWNSGTRRFEVAP